MINNHIRSDMIQSILIFTSGGTPILSWNWKGNPENTSTHEFFVSGFISAIQSIAKTVFLSRLQRIELENGYLVITGEEFSYTNPTGKKINQLLIISAFADQSDNKILVESIAKDILHEAGNLSQISQTVIIKDIEMDQWIRNYLKQKFYDRTLNKSIISGLFTIIAFLIATTFYAINYEIWISNEYEGLIQLLMGISIALLLIIISSFISGKREYGVISAVSACIIGTFLGSYLIRNIFTFQTFESDVGTFYVYFTFAVFVGFIAGYVGGYLAERTYLFP
ncbi:MAG: hypothetical protein ACXAC7_18290 [Candidatus Hodarchaeales archaeon]|jgi:hypothetical protein